ncbi:hypothetical protein [Sphingomonas sp. VNH70]|uniref:hypothetical protein n=1 Tax=Sphingomonas silueang TaxID=3156617 RepID=UPI0032B49A11
MRNDSFRPGDADHWRARGRPDNEAEALAAIWRAFPELPHDQPLEARQARSRQRVEALRPFHDAIDAAREAKRRADNFAFMDAQADEGTISTRDLAILTARDRHALDWDEAVVFADGWYAAHAGWDYNPRPWRSLRPDTAQRLAAYDLGFVEGGGNVADPFDAARRANLVALRMDNAPRPTVMPVRGRPLPSAWPKPDDAARPASWARRLALIGDASLLDRVRGHIAAQAMTVVAIGADGFACGDTADLTRPLTAARADALLGQPHYRAELRALIAGREYDDLLVIAEGEALRVIDGMADVLPLCRTMERTRNSALLQRAQLRLWLSRGRGVGDTIGGGHIRWGKTLPFLSGRLGEFTARHVGPAPVRGHLVRIETGAGRLADGYATAGGVPLDPTIVVTNKARLREAMGRALRAFAGATRLMAQAA